MAAMDGGLWKLQKGRRLCAGTEPELHGADSEKISIFNPWMACAVEM